MHCAAETNVIAGKKICPVGRNIDAKKRRRRRDGCATGDNDAADGRSSRCKEEIGRKNRKAEVGGRSQNEERRRQKGRRKKNTEVVKDKRQVAICSEKKNSV